MVFFSSESNRRVTLGVIFFKETILLEVINIPSYQNVQRFESNNGVIACAASAVADGPAERTKIPIFILTLFIIFQAVSAVLSLTNIFIIFFKISLPFLI